MILTIAMSLIPITNSYAETSIDYESIYNQGVEENYINPENLALEDWLIENVEYKKIYNDGIAGGVLESNFSYNEWIKANCYGQPPIIDSEIYEEVKILTRAYVDGFNIIPGDILITNGTSSAGIVGHAAIATGYNHILHIPGPGKTTEQLTAQQFVDWYRKKGWVKVYRIKDKFLANNAARWADRNYYSSTGSATQNIKPTYKITHELYSKNPTYCSKIVFQAYWYGTGSAPVMKAASGFMPPYALIECFNTAYKPRLAKTYN